LQQQELPPPRKSLVLPNPTAIERSLAELSKYSIYVSANTVQNRKKGGKKPALESQGSTTTTPPHGLDNRLHNLYYDSIRNNKKFKKENIETYINYLKNYGTQDLQYSFPSNITNFFSTRQQEISRPIPKEKKLQSNSKKLGFGKNYSVRVDETYSKNNYNRTPIELSESTTRLARLGPEFSNGIVKKTLETNYFNNNQNNSKLMKLIREEENIKVKKSINSRLHNSYNKLSNKNKETIRHQVMENNNIDYNLFPN
jgi:hypothetical protein